jgi:hypothetical protein
MDLGLGLGFDQAAIGMALVGLDGRNLRVNRALCELLGRSEAELWTAAGRGCGQPPAPLPAVGYPPGWGPATSRCGCGAPRSGAAGGEAAAGGAQPAARRRARRGGAAGGG